MLQERVMGVIWCCVIALLWVACEKQVVPSKSLNNQQKRSFKQSTQSPSPRLLQRTSVPKKRKHIPHSKVVSFIVLGDIMVHGTQLRSAFRHRCKCYKWDKGFSTLRPLLKSVDFAMGNVETTFPGKAGGYGGFPNFGVPDSFGLALKRAGFSLLFNANNHIYDKGTPGLVRTIRTLERLGLHHAGAYRSKKEAFGRHHVMLVKNQIKIAILSYTSHINHPRNAYRRLTFKKQHKWPRYLVNFDDQKAIQKDLAAARKAGADGIIVMHHFGPEYKRRPSARQKRVVRDTIKAGADVVIGAHPHVVQPVDARMELDRFGSHKPRLIAYSLGNVVSNMRGRHTSGGIALQFSFVKRWDTEGMTTTRLHTAKVLPLWVYRERRKKPKTFNFYVLPIHLHQKKTKQGQKRDKRIKLKPWAIAAMKRFDRSTEKLLRRGMKNIRRVFHLNKSDQRKNH